MAEALRGFFILTVLAASLGASAQPASRVETWTAVIDGPYAGIAFTWRLKADGSYEEDGRFISDNAAAQDTQTGRWTRSRTRMVMTQDSLGFAFDGTISGEQYYGTLFQYGQKVSRFCAWRGAEIPAGCDDQMIG